MLGDPLIHSHSLPLEITDMKWNLIPFKEVGRMFQSSRISVAVFVMCLTGCSDKVGAPVDVHTAQQTLVTALDGWKDGKVPEDLFEERPSIAVQEMEWSNGTKLLDYEIVSDDQPVGPNLVATVKLRLGKDDGKVTEKMATYVVGTSPKLTVYRNTMR